MPVPVLEPAPMPVPVVFEVNIAKALRMEGCPT